MVVHFSQLCWALKEQNHIELWLKQIRNKGAKPKENKAKHKTIRNTTVVGRFPNQM